jgi:acyl-CoA synthetase (AMP-forming)/AMP-acid ligase II
MSTFAVHRLSGIVTPANAMYSAAELGHQLKSSGSKALFTCAPLLETALKAARASDIPDDRVFVLDMPGQQHDRKFRTIDDLIAEGRSLPELEPLRWTKGQGARQVAYLCYSSGTSGLPVSALFIYSLTQLSTYRRFVYKKGSTTSREAGADKPNRKPS